MDETTALVPFLQRCWAGEHLASQLIRSKLCGHEPYPAVVLWRRMDCCLYNKQLRKPKVSVVDFETNQLRKSADFLLRVMVQKVWK
ncbi:hypothetical protein COV19_02085 [Candidatus Woesearchaeota archaeon CG10_big_fil_rev_8_21_14_0_10_44_13]|nr:MAG: hypothetical protein COV19_02085 [Candidatus Woesearchaeota archaeon CG10_big_fil_rev_8_21_14_0_10_44_13]